MLLANAYYQQKIINTYLVREIKIKSYIKKIKLMIYKRHSYLDKYDFQRYNLDESLLKQDEADF